MSSKEKKDVIPHSERSPGRPKGQKDLYPRKIKENFTLRKKRTFLKALENSGSVSHASDVARVSRGTVYLHMKNDPNFKRMVDEAKGRALGNLEEYAYKRVIEGETTTRKDAEGNIIETIHKPASAALIGRLLDATETYRKESNNNHLHIHEGDKSGALEKLATALGVSLESKDKDAIDGEWTEE